MTHSLLLSIATFLRVSLACLRDFWFISTIFVLPKCRVLWLRNYNITNEMTYLILLWTSVSLFALAAGAFPSFTTRNLSAVGLAVPDFYAGRAATSEDQCTSNQALPYHEIKGHPSVQRVSGLQAIWSVWSPEAPFMHSSVAGFFILFSDVISCIFDTNVTFCIFDTNVTFCIFDTPFSQVIVTQLFT